MIDGFVSVVFLLAPHIPPDVYRINLRESERRLDGFARDDLNLGKKKEDVWPTRTF